MNAGIDITKHSTTNESSLGDRVIQHTPKESEIVYCKIDNCTSLTITLNQVKTALTQGENVQYSIDSYADIVDAIHEVQVHMGIAGTTSESAISILQYVE